MPKFDPMRGAVAPLAPAPLDPDPADSPAAAHTQLPDHIPPHVWQLLQEAGERAAQRLNEILQSPNFSKLKGGEQRALIDLALTRAYGQPVKREVKLNLNAETADAVAASLGRLHDALPERRRGRTAASHVPDAEIADDT